MPSNKEPVGPHHVLIHYYNGSTSANNLVSPYFNLRNSANINISFFTRVLPVVNYFYIISGSHKSLYFLPRVSKIGIVEQIRSKCVHLIFHIYIYIYIYIYIWNDK
uniref:Uncharacterized protein n=1 Tax=Heterorhabditis bacteriophora TaxID=37862 RepID=A0A1I7W9K8_HETBA